MALSSPSAESDSATLGMPLEANGPRLIVDLAGFEGPLDLLLSLAREQKIDLSAISVLALAEQYLAFIAKIQKQNLIIAADYLVMAAWLTFLKSRFLVPDRQEDDEPDGELLAEALALRLRRLEALRKAADKLFDGPELGQERLPRGQAEPFSPVTETLYEARLFDLLAAYGARKGLEERKKVTFLRPPIIEIAEVREILDRLLGESADWVPLTKLIALIPIERAKQKSLLASSFAAALDLCKDGALSLAQDQAMGPLYIKAKSRSEKPRDGAAESQSNQEETDLAG